MKYKINQSLLCYFRSSNEVIGPIFCRWSNPLSGAWSPWAQQSGVKMLRGRESVQSGLDDMHWLSGNKILIDTSNSS